MFGGRGADDRGRLGDEQRHVVRRECGVEAPLEADRRRRLRAHRLAAKRPGDVPGVYLHAVSELDEPSQRVEQPLGALTGVDGEIRPSGVADEERVAGEDDPRIGPREGRSRRGSSAPAGGRACGCSAERPHPPRSRRRPPSDRAGTRPSAAGWMLTGTSCSSASRPWPETWSACVCVSIVRTMRTPAPLGLVEVLLDREGRIDDDRVRVSASPTRYDAQPRASSTNCVKITTRDRSSDLRYFS